MPGPQSTPLARDKHGNYVRGKTAIERADLKSGRDETTGRRLTAEEYATAPNGGRR